MKSRTKIILQGIALTMTFFFTSGIILPWVISNFIMPVWMILMTLGAITVFWVLVLEKPVDKMVSIMKAHFEEVTETASNNTKPEKPLC